MKTTPLTHTISVEEGLSCEQTFMLPVRLIVRDGEIAELSIGIEPGCRYHMFDGSKKAGSQAVAMVQCPDHERDVFPDWPAAPRSAPRTFIGRMSPMKTIVKVVA